MDFVKQLNKQLGFLDRSATLWDQGHREEAVRIATAIRVLLHQTGSSTALLNHLGAQDIDLRSTTPPIPENVMQTFGLGRARIGGGQRPAYEPRLGFTSYSELIPAQEWWSQTIHVENYTRISRRTLVLAAANKDGGAHVDKELDPSYEALGKPGAMGTFRGIWGGQSEIIPITDADSIALRQMAWELLNSESLKSLATAGRSA